MATPTTSSLSSAEFKALIDAVHAHGRAQFEAVVAGHDPLPAYQLPDHISQAQLDEEHYRIRFEFDENGRQPLEAQLDPMGQFVAELAAAQAEVGAPNFVSKIDQQVDLISAVFQGTHDYLNVNLKELGQEHPDWNALIVQTFQIYSDFAAGLVNQVVNYLNNLKQDYADQWSDVPSVFDGFHNQIETWFASLG